VSRRRRGTDSATPAIVVAPATVGVLFLLVPTVALLIRTPWTRLGAIYRDQHVWTALRISI
jgi:molybdate transport system permease protein